MASITYEFSDPSTGFRATCVIEETGDGTLRFTIDVDESTGTVADLRGLFFDMNLDDQGFLDSLIVTGDEVSDSLFRKDGVTDLGNGANVNGEVIGASGKFDAGIEIGSSGLMGGNDDVQWTQFTLSSSLCDLTLDMLESVDTALRATSVGDADGSRNGSLKLVGDLTSGVITGFYFWDRDGDDVDSDGDTGIAGKRVSLHNADGTAAVDAAGNAVAAVETAADGGYMFTNVAAGDYVVAFEDSSEDGLAWVAPNRGTDDAIDSDVDPATGRTGVITVVAGCETTDVDAGVKAEPEAPPPPGGGTGGEEAAWDLTGTIRAPAHSLTFIMDASFSTYDQYHGIRPVDVNRDGINNVIDAMLAAVIDRAQGLASDQRIDLVLAGGDGVLGQQTVHARDLHGLDPHDPADAAALQAIFRPVFDRPAGLPDVVDFASALTAAGDAVRAGHGATGALKDEIILLTTSDGVDDVTFLPAYTGYAEAAQALVASLGATVDVMLIEPNSFDPSVLGAIDSDGVVDSYSSIFENPFNRSPDPFMLGTLVSDSPAVTEGDILGLLIGGEHFAFTGASNGDGRIDVALTGLEADPAAGIGVEIDTDHDGVADTVVAASLEFIDGAWHFEIGPADLLV